MSEWRVEGHHGVMMQVLRRGGMAAYVQQDGAWAVGRGSPENVVLKPDHEIANGWERTRDAAQAAAERAIAAEEGAPSLTGWRELLDGELLWDGGKVVCKVLRARERWAWQVWSGGRLFASGHEVAREAAQAKAERVIAVEEGAW